MHDGRCWWWLRDGGWNGLSHKSSPRPYHHHMHHHLSICNRRNKSRRHFYAFIENQSIRISRYTADTQYYDDGDGGGGAEEEGGNDNSSISTTSRAMEHNFHNQHATGLSINGREMVRFGWLVPSTG